MSRITRRITYLLVVLLLLSGCRSFTTDPEISGYFASLTEDQKRLPENALSGMTILEGLEVELFASEPLVTNPTNISVDNKGRVWVCEAYNYDVSSEQEDKAGDRIVVLEDTDHDGKADRRTVFYQGTDITTPLGIMVLGNKVYVTRSPNLFIFTDTDGDLVADEKEILFTNMGSKGDHSAHAMFPGPDGRFYFSIGNHAGEIQDKEGNAILDKAGFAINQKGKPYLGGMVLRCDPDGSNFEVLGHNFRNNYEPCIDSYGNIWQSDNDDDGNASCRINFVMPYGNYGFLDEMTRASWGTNRVNIEATIPERHWHQSDPGVVPNVLITGAGSPSGMTVYEGEILPPIFRGMPIHAEPYYNVVRAYITQKIGAGYTAESKDILKSEDQWFRPVDVTTAPDGSLFVADWYDPILGGGAAGDAVRGRIYRIAPEADSYHVPQLELSSIEGSVRALKNPNIETRYLGFQQLLGEDENAIPALLEMWESDDPVFRARALWLLARMNSAESFLREALNDKNPDIRTAAVRATLQTQDDVVPLLTLVKNDPDPSVRREASTSLRYTGTPKGAALWTELAQQHDGKDRWYLEALGIGADRHADLYFETWRNKVSIDLNNTSHQDIIWRSRSAKVLPLLSALIRNADNVKTSLRYFRAFDFHTHKSKNEELLSLLDLDQPDSKQISVVALQQMDGREITVTPFLKRVLEGALQETKGSVAFINLVEKFQLKNKTGDLLALAIEQGGHETGKEAVDLLIRFNETARIEKALHQNDSVALALLQSLNGKGNSVVVDLISAVVGDDDRSLVVRHAAVQALGSSWPGEERLLNMVKKTEFANDLKPVAGSVLFNVYRSWIQREAAQYLPQPSTKGSSLPSIKELLASSGNVENGKIIFSTHCANCHKVNEEGVKFGPELSQIGSKLSKEGLLRAIIYPDEGISYGYEGYLLTLHDGGQAMGIIGSETDSQLELILIGGGSIKFSKDQIKQRERSDMSLMPSLTSVMSHQELIDLVSYLSLLRN